MVPTTLQLLASLSKIEMAKFLRFLQSPYFNNLDFFPKLLDALTPFHPEFENLNKLDLFQSILPDELITNAYINERLSQLHKLTKQFLQQEELKKNIFQKQQLELATAYERNEPKWFTKTFKNVQTDLLEKHPSHWEDTLQLWSNFNLMNDFPQANTLASQVDDLNTIQYLDEYYILQKLRYVCNLHATKQFYKSANAKVLLIDEIQKLVKKDFHYHPIIRLYYQLLLLFQEPVSIDFEDVKTQFDEIYHKLKNSDKFFILINLVNHGMNKVNEGKTEFIPIVFELYRSAVENQLFLNRSPLTETTYLNICTYGAFCNEAHWTKRFIKSHNHLLAMEDRKRARKMGNALFLFYTGNFEKAFHAFNEVQGNDYGYKLRIRSLSARCLLELQLKYGNTYKTLLSKTKSNKLFLYRNKDLALPVRNGYINMNTAILKIADLNLARQNKRLLKAHLLKWINSRQHLATKAWLIKKIEALGID